MTESQKNELIKIAKSLVGKPYKYGAKPEEAPECFDCSSFIQYIFKQIKIELPRSTILQADCGEIVKDIKSLEPGDLLFFHGTQGFYNKKFPAGIGHVILYIGNNKTIHAASQRIKDSPQIVEDGAIEERDLNDVVNKLKPLVVIKRN